VRLRSAIISSHRAASLAAAFAFLVMAPVAFAQYGGGPGGGGAPSSAPDEAQEEQAEEQGGSRRPLSRDEGREARWQHRWEDRQEIRPRTAKRLSEARDHVAAEKYDAATEVLGELRFSRLNSVEKARAYQIRAFISFGRGDLPEARDDLERAIAENVFEADELANTRYQIAQLWMQEQNWAETVKNLELWFTMEPNPNSAAYYLLALSYYQLESYDEALPHARTAIDSAEQPQESWLQLMLAILLTRKDFQAAIPVVDELVTHFPKKAYWLNLSTVHGVLGNYEEALIPLQLAYTQGLLTNEAELLRLSQLLLFLDLPYRSAEVLRVGLEQKAIDHKASAWEMLSNSWIAAREFNKAVAPLQRAAGLAATGDLYVRLAQVHIQREKWQAASDALRQAIEKGDLEKPGDAQILMGIAYYSQDRPEQARSWFARAREHEPTRQEADTWLRHIERELSSG
jgi:tetratricopeptide (TPR) repeat protein